MLRRYNSERRCRLTDVTAPSHQAQRIRLHVVLLQILTMRYLLKKERGILSAISHYLDQLAVMFFTFFCVFLIAFILQVISFPITISTNSPPQANQESRVVLTHDPYCFYLVSFAPRVTSGRGHERHSTEDLVATHKLPISFTISGQHHIDTLCREPAVLYAPSPDAHVVNEGIGTNDIVFRSATFEVLENLNNEDLLKGGGQDLTIRADNGGPVILKKVKNSRNKTTGGVTINGGRGGTAISGNAKIKVGQKGLSGNTTTVKNGTATSGKVTINGGSGGTATSGDATTGDGGNSTSGSASTGGNDGSAISGDATTGDGGSATSGNAISSGSDGSAISGDATVNGTSSAYGEPVSSAAATSVGVASGTTSPSTSTTSSRHDTKTPVIIGSTIGSLALVGILVLLAILWRRRKRRSREGDASEEEGLPTDSGPRSTRTSTISSSSSTYPSPFEPIRRGGDFPLTSGDSLPQTRTLSPSRASFWPPPREGNQSLVVEVGETTYGASPPPSYLSPQ
ncbi:hypothetical protein IW261DRAFT_1487450 [Armillaria novae-zelandiae]|uniref:Uncharacterized protein n=1 Tax=Armillaria novae-zelandiae TaxID=153914 RepID=A0AA39P4M5_9AGAR|nr:hypothetical protein IW261DRAFT_1487450 [Armillaria novae-zelandiae]